MMLLALIAFPSDLPPVAAVVASVTPPATIREKPVRRFARLRTGMVVDLATGGRMTVTYLSPARRYELVGPGTVTLASGSPTSDGKAKVVPLAALGKMARNAWDKKPLRGEAAAQIVRGSDDEPAEFQPSHLCPFGAVRAASMPELVWQGRCRGDAIQVVFTQGEEGYKRVQLPAGATQAPFPFSAKGGPIRYRVAFMRRGEEVASREGWVAALSTEEEADLKAAEKEIQTLEKDRTARIEALAELYVGLDLYEEARAVLAKLADGPQRVADLDASLEEP